MKKFLLVLCVVGLMLSACAPKADSASLIGSWKLVSYGDPSNPTTALPDKDATLTFDDKGQMSGNVGCNGFGGDYKVDGDQITFGPVMSTMMACAPDELMVQEQSVLSVLSESVDYKIEGKTLTITKNGEALVLEAVSGN